MKFRIAHASLLFAALLAAGSHLDLAQIAVWGRMFTGFAQTMPLREAIAKTFAPESACSLCRAVSHAREDQENTPLADTRISKKIVLAFAPITRFFASAANSMHFKIQNWKMPPCDKASPPVPPPRKMS